MFRFLLPLAVIAPTFGAAQTSGSAPRLEAAQNIQRLSNVYDLPEPDTFRLDGSSLSGKSVMIVEDCDVTIVNYRKLFSSPDPEGMTITFDLSTTDLIRFDDGTHYAHSYGQFYDPQDAEPQNRDLTSLAFGMIRFASSSEILIREHGDITEGISFDDLRRAPVVDSWIETDFTYMLNGFVTADRVAALAQGLIEYKRDYCTLAS